MFIYYSRYLFVGTPNTNATDMKKLNRNQNVTRNSFPSPKAYYKNTKVSEVKKSAKGMIGDCVKWRVGLFDADHHCWQSGRVGGIHLLKFQKTSTGVRSQYWLVI